MDAFITLISFPVLFQSSATGARQRVDNKLETCMHSTTSQMSTRDRIGAILRVTSGNFLEQFDFFLFGFYAFNPRRHILAPVTKRKTDFFAVTRGVVRTVCVK